MFRNGQAHGYVLLMSGLISLCMAIAPAMAAPVTFQFAGHLTSVDPAVTTATGFTAGHLFSGSYTFESTTPISSSQPTSANYMNAVTHLDAKIDTQLVVAPQPITASAISIRDNQLASGGLVDRYIVLGSAVNPGETSAGSVSAFLFRLENGFPSTFDSTSLPTHPPSLSSFSVRQAIFLFRSGQAIGTLTSLTAVPVPAAVLLFGTGLTALIGLGAGSWRRRQLRMA